MAWSGPNEPVRKNGLTAGVVVAASTFFGGIAVGFTSMETLDALNVVIVVSGSLGTALAQLGVVAFGVHAGAEKAYGPQTVDEIMDAESVINAAERGDHG